MRVESFSKRVITIIEIQVFFGIFLKKANTTNKHLQMQVQITIWSNESLNWWNFLGAIVNSCKLSITFSQKAPFYRSSTGFWICLCRNKSCTPSPQYVRLPWIGNVFWHVKNKFWVVCMVYSYIQVIAHLSIVKRTLMQIRKSTVSSSSYKK